MRRWARERFSAFSYAITVLAVRLGMRLCSRLEVLHADRVPREGPAILVANHLTNADPVLVCACAPRTLRVMAKRELFELPLVGWTLWAFGAFPVRRWSADLGALRAGRNHLRAGRAVLVFPEGTRSESRALQPALPGSAVLALLGGAPVVPVAITGMEAFAGHPPHFRQRFPRQTLGVEPGGDHHDERGHFEWRSSSSGVKGRASLSSMTGMSSRMG